MSHDTSQAQLIVGLGERRYHVERPFGRFDMRDALVTDVACDSRGHVFVLLRIDPLVDAPIPQVVELAPDGAFVKAFGEADLVDGHMLAVDGDDRIYVVDRDAHHVVIFDRSGAVLGGLGKRHEPDSPFSHPTDVAFGRDGSIYVTDGYGAHRVHRFSADGERLKTWGVPGKGPGAFSTPHGIWVTKSDRVLVADRENDRIQVFSPDGDYLEEWTDFSRPMSIWCDDAGHVYVTDQVPRLIRLTEHGEMTGCCKPVVDRGHGIWGNAAGDLYIAELSPSRVTRLVLAEH